jgi:hypothetical protein
MIKGFVREAMLKARMNTGFSGAIVIWSAVATVSFVVAFVFVLIAAFIWLESRSDAVTAGLVLAGVFLAIALVALLAGVFARRRTIREARAELMLAAAARQQAATSWLDPKMVAVGAQLIQSIGMRRIVPIAAVGLLAASLGREWARARGDSHEPES